MPVRRSNPNARRPEMDRLPEKETWERLEVLLGEGDGGRLHEYLDGLPPGEPARAVSRLNGEAQDRLLALLTPRRGADLVAELPAAQAAELLGVVSPERAAVVLSHLPSDARADLLGG